MIKNKHKIDENIVWHNQNVTKEKREELLNQKPCILWFTGLSGSGKSTIANAVEHELFKRGVKTYLLDGDNVRHGLNKDLGFSKIDRIENIRRIGEVSKLLEVFVNTPLKICESRDPKGLYQKARNGDIKNFTGIDSPYEEPLEPRIELQTDKLNIRQCCDKIIKYLIKYGYIKDE